MKTDDHREIARGLFRESPDVLILFDTDTHALVDVNPAGMRITGLSRKQAERMFVWDMLESDSEQGVRQLIESYRRTGYFQASRDFRLRRADGSDPVPVLITVCRIHTRPRPLGLVIAHDLSEFRQAQETIDHVFRLSSDLLCVARDDGRIERANPAWQASLGDRLPRFPAAEPDTDADDSRQPTAPRTPCDRDELEIETREDRVQNRNGEERVVVWRGLHADGRTYRVGRDVTELRRLEALAQEAETTREAHESLENARKFQAGFLAAIGHEIRNPLAAILDTAKLIETDPAVAHGPESIRELVRLLGDNARQLLGVTADLLDHSRIDAGQMKIEPALCSPRKIVDEVVASCATRAAARGLILHVLQDPGVPDSLGTDPVRLRQILTNLTTNAVKYTERGWIQLRLGPDQNQGGIRIDVTDTGIGMPAESLARLFEPFFRTPEVQKKGLEGTGLGLSISKRLVDLLGGKIAVESMPGLGTSFRVTLPNMTVANPQNGEPTAAGTSPLLRGRVLIADDFEANRHVLAHHLRRAGLSVETAANGEEVLARIQQPAHDASPCDLILMDMQMPCLDGYEATRRLRRSGFPGAIIALTAFASPRDRDECLAIGCDDHLTKPIDYPRLIATVGKHLAGRPHSQTNHLKPNSNAPCGQPST